MSVLAVAASLLIALGIARSILRVLGGDPAVIRRIAERVADGDLTIGFGTSRAEDTGIYLSMKQMVEKLRTIVQDIKTAADNVASGSQELSAGSEQMSQGTTEQAASAEEASSSVEEMNAMSRQNVENATQTEKIAIKAAQDAREGGKAREEPLPHLEHRCVGKAWRKLLPVQQRRLVEAQPDSAH